LVSKGLQLNKKHLGAIDLEEKVTSSKFDGEKLIEFIASGWILTICAFSRMCRRGDLKD